jgi:ParB/RepB/Spo0J family partition protein
MDDFNFKNTTQAKIPLKKIRENSEALRTAVDKQDEDYIQLVDSVKKRGIMNPILVREIKDPASGEILYGLIDGLHRFNAAMDAGLNEIPAQIGSLKDADLIEAQILANVHRIETKAVQYTKALIKIMSANPLLTMTELASRLSKSNSWLRDRLQLVKLNEPIQKLVDSGDIGLANAYALAKLPPEKQDELANQAISLSPNEFIPIATSAYKAIRDARSEGRAPAEEGFVPVPRLQRPVTLKEELAAFAKKEFTSSKVGTLVLQQVQNQPDEVKLMCLASAEIALKYSMHLDPESVEFDRHRYEQRKKERDEDKKKREAERQQKKDQAAKAVTTTAGVGVNGHPVVPVNLNQPIDPSFVPQNGQ